MIGIIPVSYPIVQATRQHPQAEIGQEKTEPDSAFPEKRNSREGKTQHDAVKNK
jgi:hypothetical protein